MERSLRSLYGIPSQQSSALERYGFQCKASLCYV
jgi:hypothetical protein